jgi:hypothetical protein
VRASGGTHRHRPLEICQIEPPQILTETLVYFPIMSLSEVLRHSDAKLGGKYTLNDNWQTIQIAIKKYLIFENEFT